MWLPLPSGRALFTALLFICAATLLAERHIRVVTERAAHSEELLQIEADRARLHDLERQLAEVYASCPMRGKDGGGGHPNGSAGFGPQCKATAEEMARYLDYRVRGDCPDDWFFVQKLIFVKNCHCLPRRQCRALSPPSYRDPLPSPQALFDPAALRDENVMWGSHNCKSYACVNARRLGDCPNCFNLTLEALRWRFAKRGTIKLEEVVAMTRGGLRLGLDAGGGTGTFAAKMAARNCTILTTAMDVETLFNVDAGLPYMETIAQRGLVPLHLPHAARLPLFDNTLDIVHSVNSIKYPSLPEFEALLWEWDRVLRPGGILWFELFYAPVTEMPLYVGVLELLSYGRRYWNISPKTDRPERDGAHVYLNCVLEKPRRAAAAAAASGQARRL